MKRYSAAIVGCGKIGSWFDPNGAYKITTHAGAYRNTENTDLVALCDVDKYKLKTAGKKWQVSHLYKNYREMLDNEDIDILSICTWNQTHYEILKYAVQSGLSGIFCEKPIATSLDEADDMIKLCKKYNVSLMINHQRRFDPFHKKIKNFIDEGNIGEVQQATFYYSSGIANFGSHMFDILRFCFGEAEFVQAYYKNNSEDPNIDGLVRFKNNLTTMIQSFDNKHYSIFDLNIIGTDGALKINKLGLDAEFYDIKESDLIKGYKELTKIGSKVYRDPNDSPILYGVKHLIDCIENNKIPISSGEDARESLALICAFHESAMQDGKIITLPLKTSNIKIKSK